MENEKELIFQGNYPYPLYAPWWQVEEGKTTNQNVHLDEVEEIGVDYDVDFELDYDP